MSRTSHRAKNRSERTSLTTFFQRQPFFGHSVGGLPPDETNKILVTRNYMKTTNLANLAMSLATFVAYTEARRGLQIAEVRGRILRLI